MQNFITCLESLNNLQQESEAFGLLSPEASPALYHRRSVKGTDQPNEVHKVNFDPLIFQKGFHRLSQVYPPKVVAGKLGSVIQKSITSTQAAEQCIGIRPRVLARSHYNSTKFKLLLNPEQLFYFRKFCLKLQRDFCPLIVLCSVRFVQCVHRRYRRSLCEPESNAPRTNSTARSELVLDAA